MCHIPIHTLSALSNPKGVCIYSNNGNNGYLQKAERIKFADGTIVRAKNDSSSGQVGYIDVETVLGFSEIVGGWYYVVLSDGTRGYIYSSRCTEVK